MMEEYSKATESPVASSDAESLRTRVAALEAELARRQDIERQYRISEERYRSLVETMSDGLGMQDEHGLITYVNSRLERMLGYAREEVVGRSTVDFIEDAYRVLFTQKMAAHRRGEYRPYEMVWRMKDGQGVHTLVSPAPVLTASGDFGGTFAIIADITERKREEATRARERALIQTLMDSVPDYIYIKDSDSRFIMSNAAHLRILRANTLGDVLGKSDFDFFPQELAEQYFANEQAVMLSGQPLANKIEQTVDPDGNPIWVMTYKAPLRDSRGVIVGIVGISRDITELRRTEQALRESEERFRLIFENSRDTAYKLDLGAGRYTYISPSVSALTGRSPETVLAMGREELENRVHPDDRERVAQHYRGLGPKGPDGTPASIVEYRIAHDDGRFRWVSESFTIVRREGQDETVRVGIIRDISEQKETEMALHAASRMEATAVLAKGIAHTFNNLMVGVLGNAELLQMHMANDLRAMQMLSTIARSARQAGELAQHMISFARGGKYRPAAMDLNETIAETLRLEERSIPSRVRVRCDLDPGLWHVMADAVQVGQVVFNLTFNAVEAIEDNGRIVISTHNIEADESFGREHGGLAAGRYVMLSIEDTGRGMAPEVREKIFEPFFTTKFEGRGLGLSAVYGIVKNHGGHIDVISTPGEGSCFRVYFPAVDRPAAKPTKVVHDLPTGKETVLIVDDEDVVLNVTDQVLQRLGYRVLRAKNGLEALDIARNYPHDIHIALLDLGMPVMAGSETYPLLMTARPKLKVVLTSGYEFGPAAEAMMKAGASGFLQKPFTSRLLAVEVRKALDA